LERQNRFGQGYDNLHFDSGENWAWGPAFDGVVRPWTSPIDSDGDGAIEALTRPFSAVPDQLQEFFNIGRTFSNSINLSGSNNGFTYYASYSNTDQKGILENTWYKRNTVTFNASAKLSERVRSDFKISYANVNQNTAQEGSRAFEGNNAYAMAVQSPVNIPFGELRDYTSPFHDIDGYWGSYSSVNPYYILNEYGNEGRINNFLGNASVTYNVIEGLDLVGRFGANVINTTIDTWTPVFTPAQQLVWGDDLSLTTRDTKHNSLGEYVNYFAADEPQRVLGDAKRLAQVFSNLLVNAIQAMATGGQLTVACTRTASGVEVTFTDTGKGFSEEALTRFSEFFFSEKEGGMGIGLSVASEIVKAHGGELRVANRAEGGARVTVSLPARHIAPTASGSAS
jgi:hypothetical protein